VHYYTKNIADFNNATRHLSRQERSIYLDLIELQYDMETPLPGDLDWICRRILALSDSERTDVERMLNEYFDSVEQGWSNARCESEIAAFKDKRAKAVIAGKASGLSRKRNKKPNINKGKEAIEQTFNECSTDVEPTINHKPITTIKNRGFIKPTLPELINEFSSRVTNPDREANAFLNHYESNGWKVGKNPMKSWRHAVTNWITRGKENYGNGNGHNGKAVSRRDQTREAIDALTGESSTDTGWIEKAAELRLIE
jgi:uncharacterized protein YdaU (DUF1376 family)